MDLSQNKYKKIAFIVPYPIATAPSQRFRFEQYLPTLEQQYFSFQIFPFLSQAAWKILYVQGHQFLKINHVFLGFLHRFSLLFKIHSYDWIFIHREATPLGPPLWEWIVAKLFLKKIIYDFDDAIWIPNTSFENKWLKHIKWHTKVPLICKWTYKVSAGNHYLVNYAKTYQVKSFYNPTTIDLNWHTPKINQKGENIIIGWTGTHSTLKYLDTLRNVLDKLWLKHHFMLHVIANKNPQWDTPYFKFIEWNKEYEIRDLSRFDIGLMPLIEDEWSNGKCGFKALQYMALEIPAVVSPVGVNHEIVEHGTHGFLCKTEQDWYESLTTLLNNPSLRDQMGKNGRRKVEESFSINSNATNFISLFS